MISRKFGTALAGVSLCMSVLAAGPAQAATVNCGDVITQNTVLEADVGPCSGTGLVVMGGVVLDLGGHALVGADSGAGTGVLMAGDGGRVTNGAVTGFSTGVSTTGLANTIERLLIRGNGTGVDLSSFNTVRQNSIRGNSSHGISVARDRPGWGRANRMEGNVITENALLGVGIESFGGLRTRADMNVVAGNLISANGTEGVYISPHSDSTRVDRNVITANGRNGVLVLGPFLAATVTNNQVLGNGMNGVLVTRLVSAGAVNLPNNISANTARDNGAGSPGFDLADENRDCFGTNWSGNTFVTRNQPCVN
jgi:hypothetical protein